MTSEWVDPVRGSSTSKASTSRRAGQVFLALKEKANLK
jgi:hypothetical protein